MNGTGISRLLNALTGERITFDSRQENIYVSCPLAQWTHQNGYDKSRGFSIKVNPFGGSPCYCWNTACGFKGTLFQLLAKFEDYSEAYNQHARDIYSTNSSLDPSDLLNFLEEDFEGAEKLDISMLDGYPPFREPWRELTPKTLEAWDVRLDAQKSRVLFPVYTRDQELVGAVGRTVNGHKLKYLNYWGFKKSRVLFGEGVDCNKHVIILEGQVDALKVWQAFDGTRAAVALMGSKPSKTQLHRLVTYYDSATIFLDNDVAGLAGLLPLVEGLIKEMPVFNVSKPYKGDPGALSSEEIVSLVTNAVPIILGLA